MKEKVRFISIGETARDGLYNLTTSDGRKGLSYFKFDANKDYNVYVSDGHHYKGEMIYYFNMEEKTKQPPSVSRDNRRVALEVASRWGDRHEPEEIIGIADLFLEWLNR